MKRLTKQYPNGNITLEAAQFGIDQNTLDGEIKNSEPIAAAVKRLAEFEDAEEKGLLVHLPCKAGDTVWTAKYGESHPFTVTMFAVVADTDGIQKLQIVCGTTEFLMSEIGKTVFLTPEAAQQALKVREK